MLSAAIAETPDVHRSELSGKIFHHRRSSFVSRDRLPCWEDPIASARGNGHEILGDDEDEKSSKSDISIRR